MVTSTEAALPHPVPASVAEGRVHSDRSPHVDSPDPRLIAAMASACGVPAFALQPMAGGTPGRVWLLRPEAPLSGDGAPAAPLPADRVLKLAPGRTESALLALANDLDIPAARIEAWSTLVGPTPVATAGPPSKEAQPTAVCLAALPGRPLSQELHAGGAIPVDAWAQAIARVHRVAPTALRTTVPDLPRAPSPSEWCGAQLPQLVAEARRLAPVDVGLLLVAAADRLVGLAAAVDAEPVLCHGDWAAEHVLVSHGAVTGVVDWEHAWIGPAAYDLATAVVGLFARGLSARAALALGDSLAAAYAAVTGGKPPALAFPVGAQALERAVAAVSRRAVGAGGADVSAWSGLLGVCLGAA